MIARLLVITALWFAQETDLPEHPQHVSIYIVSTPQEITR